MRPQHIKSFVCVFCMTFARSCSNIPLPKFLCLLDFRRLWLHAARQNQKSLFIAVSLG